MAWFRRNKPKIEEQPNEEERKVKTEGIFVKCPECDNALYKRELKESFQVCTHCDYHFRFGARQRLDMLFDESEYEKLDENITSADPLEFVDTKPYIERIEDAKRKSGLPEAVVTGKGTVGGSSRLCRRDGYVVYRRFDGFGGRRKTDTIDRIRSGKQRRGRHFFRFRRSANAGRNLFLNADGENLGGTRSFPRSQTSLHFRFDRSDDRRRNGEFCDARRCQYRRTASLDRFCRTACYRTNDSPKTSERFSKKRILTRTRNARYGR